MHVKLSKFEEGCCAARHTWHGHDYALPISGERTTLLCRSYGREYMSASHVTFRNGRHSMQSRICQAITEILTSGEGMYDFLSFVFHYFGCFESFLCLLEARSALAFM